MNKKVKNATVNTKAGITFKSLLESRIYTRLVKEGFSPLYEANTVVLQKGFKPITPYYTKETALQQKKRVKDGDKELCKLLAKKNTLLSITYTPDFYFKYKGINIYIEGKGRENDVYPLKRKMFIKYLDENSQRNKSMFFEVYTLKQLEQVIDILHSL